MKRALITGTSSGLGRGLASSLSTHGWTVYGCSRRGCDLADVRHRHCDLAVFDAIPGALSDLLEEVTELDLVVLNAGILGAIKQLTGTSLDEVQAVMNVNVWANKVIMDWLFAWGRPVDQIVMISSGASVLGNKGWGGYAISKAALNMLCKLYSHEFARTHIAALAPGIIDTEMMEYLCTETDVEAFPALQRLRQARKTPAMPGSLQAAERVISVLPKLKERPSGTFTDIREILDPDEYARLFAGSGPG